ncbi:helix-turn-helix transcriptional regulator [Exiguobacterium sp. TBG-PICH-001]|uniref:helix-turn-helix domain-containing protein n=1 Tax=Exiguobacterium abrahamii TaxID=2785532 RepID=UPI0018A736B1|nr:helix-turn-helix transcriptional regulator [Exiguobacterium sp. TBG-PICH-001]MBF8154342.1 helix-turn-helix transcriptional regulator [Exiguobacterium sp. TBG-PICH-001]
MKEGVQPIEQYGQRIRTLRERHQLDQNTLAALTETTPEMIQRIESSIAHPSFSMIERLARVLHVPSDHLIRHIWPPAVIRQQDSTSLIDLPSS